MPDPIATRILTFRTPERDIPVPVRIDAPIEVEPNYWECHFAIDWPEEPYQGRVGAFDATQALVLVLQAVSGQIYFSEWHKTGNLFWDKPGSGYGYPANKYARDLLIGDDLRFDGDN